MVGVMARGRVGIRVRARVEEHLDEGVWGLGLGLGSTSMKGRPLPLLTTYCLLPTAHLDEGQAAARVPGAGGVAVLAVVSRLVSRLGSRIASGLLRRVASGRLVS